MQRASQHALACPACRRAFDLVSHDEQDGDVISGFLSCDGCGVIVPIVESFALFTEPRLHEGHASATALETLTERLFGNAVPYETFRRNKDERDHWESYAAFQPFNESTRIIEPLLPAIRAHLKPGDFILDTWSRTGWSGEWLAGLFPDNRVISLWEGDSNVLGYRGFRHWLGHGRRAANLDVMFVPPGHPLPFATHAFGFVYALDSLHRYDLYPFAGECMRAARPDAALLFAHIHLTNSEPDPFFERGCHQYHGGDYRAWLDGLLKNDPRRGWVMSEADLFNAPAGEVLKDTPDTPHYNGDVLIADPARATMIVEARAAPTGQARLLVNPLLRLDFSRGAATVEDAMKDGDVGHLLDRHPVYRERLPQGPRALSAEDWLIVCKAAAGLTVDDAAGDNAEAFAGLIADEIVLPVAVSHPALDLQRFHANQLPLVPRDHLLASLFDSLKASEAPAIVFADGASLGGSDMIGTLGALTRVLVGEKPARVIIEASDEPLGLLALLAAMAGGLEISLVAPSAFSLSDLLIHNRPAGPEGVRALSLYGEDDSLAGRLQAALEAGDPAPDIQSGGGVTFPTKDGAQRLDTGVLLEAACSMRHAVRADLSGVEDFAGVNALLLCLTALFRGEPAAFGGVARPLL